MHINERNNRHDLCCKTGECLGQNKSVNIAFYCLTKAFDTVIREAIWKISEKDGCNPKICQTDTFSPRKHEHIGIKKPMNISTFSNNSRSKTGMCACTNRFFIILPINDKLRQRCHSWRATDSVDTIKTSIIFATQIFNQKKPHVYTKNPICR